MTVSRSRIVGLLLVLAATVATCGGHDAAYAAAPAAHSVAAPTGERGSERVVPGGDCECANGSEFFFWVRKANPKKVVFYLQDSGTCWSARTCAWHSDYYDPKINQSPTDEAGGVMNLANGRNPFAGYSFVWVPYCTGDLLLGDTTTTYGPGLTVHHKGYANGTAALDHLAAVFPHATNIVVIGESITSIAAPLYAGLASDRLSDARITVLADGSGSFPGGPAAGKLLAAWGFGKVIPRWPENAGLSADQWSPARFYIQSGRHDHDIVFARHDYAYDGRQTLAFRDLGIPVGDLLSRIDANEAKIEHAGVNLLSFIAPGDGHTMLTKSSFYTEEVNGEKLVDWVSRLIESKPVADVHCRHCRGG